MLQPHPNDGYILYANGWLELQAGRFSDAKKHLQESLSLNPNFSSTNFSSRHSAGQAQRAASGQTTFEEVLAPGNQQPEDHFELAKVLKTVGETQEAKHQPATFQQAKDAESQQNLIDAITSKADQE